MPDVRNCKRCGKIFNYMGGEVLCPVCRDEDEKDYQKVKEYLYRYPGATLSEVATTLEVSVEKIKKFLREDRLEIVNTEGNIFLDCERCGRPIKSGRFCEDCEREITGKLKTAYRELSQKTSIMHERDIYRGSEYLRYLKPNASPGGKHDKNRKEND